MVGAVASGLCILHCVATPFLFLASSYAAASIEKPVWWQSIDYFFLLISFLAIRRSAQTSSRRWVGVVMLLVWIFLLLAIGNETLELLALPELVVYIPAFGLIGLHLYNQRFCKCGGADCCAGD